MLPETDEFTLPSGTITIQPYVDPQQSNMGLEKYNIPLFDNIIQEEPLICLESNGIRRYKTGLNEFAPEVMALEPDERRAKTLEIRHLVRILEMQLAANELDVSDPNFWSKVLIVRPNNNEFWDGIMMRVSNKPQLLDIKNDPHALIKFIAIEAGGFSLVATSLEDARNRPVPVKFFLDKYENTASIRTEGKKARNKALGLLDKLFNKDVTKLLYVAKVVSASGPQFRKTTPADVLYDAMDGYINGEAEEKNKERAIKDFIKVAESDMDTVKLRAIIKDSTYYRLIITRGDGTMYHSRSMTPLGKNATEVLTSLKSPSYDSTLIALEEDLAQYWNK